MESIYNKAFTEVYTILQYLDEEELEKIPNEILDIIKENRDKEYTYEMNADLDLKEQRMLPETKALLFNLFRDYLSLPEQKEKIIRMQKEERIKNEEKKKIKYAQEDKKEEKIKNEEKKEDKIIDSESYPVPMSENKIIAFLFKVREKIISFLKFKK